MCSHFTLIMHKTCRLVDINESNVFIVMREIISCYRKNALLLCLILFICLCSTCCENELFIQLFKQCDLFCVTLFYVSAYMNLYTLSDSQMHMCSSLPSRLYWTKKFVIAVSTLYLLCTSKVSSLLRGFPIFYALNSTLSWLYAIFIAKYLFSVIGL